MRPHAFPCVVFLALLGAAIAAGCDEPRQQATDIGAETDVADDSTTADEGDSLASDGAADSGTSDTRAADTAPDVPPAHDQVVTTALGDVRGHAERGIASFLGIPYAAPPVGSLRFRPPQPVVPWAGELDATSYGPTCAQVGTGRSYEGEEDCLTLNIWAPDPLPAAAPVMVWIHGGGFSMGSGSEEIYAGNHLASQGVVVVTLNYRLGALGFLAHDALAAEDSAHATSGVYGMEDQTAGLAWVRDHIAAFGGDPDNVTLFGESAGGMAVCLHLVMPASRDLFHRAIIQSGPCVGAFLPQDDTLQRQSGEALVAALGCDVAADVPACLRGFSAEEIQTATTIPAAVIYGEGNIWLPAIDGQVIPALPSSLFATGEFAQVPVLVGSNADEGALFTLMDGVTLDEAGYEAVVNERFGADAAAVLAAYPASSYPSPDKALERVLTEAFFVCPTQALARMVSARAPAYVYHFVHAPNLPFFPDGGAFHGAELLYLFGNRYLGQTMKSSERPMAQQMQRYWTRFAGTADPNGSDDPVWPPFTDADERYLTIDLESNVGTDLFGPACAFWDGL